MLKGFGRKKGFDVDLVPGDLEKTHLGDDELVPLWGNRCRVQTLQCGHLADLEAHINGLALEGNLKGLPFRHMNIGSDEKPGVAVEQLVFHFFISHRACFGGTDDKIIRQGHGGVLEANGSNAVVVFDLVIGNKRVMKDTPVFAAGSPYCFANTGNITTLSGEETAQAIVPRHQVYMEGAGILIPPQVQWYVQYTIYNVVTGAIIAPSDNSTLGCYLFGTKVLLNFNTSI